MLKREKIEHEIGEGIGTELILMFSVRVFKKMRLSVANASCRCWDVTKFLNREGVEWCGSRNVKIVEYVRREFKLQRGRDTNPVTVDFDVELVSRFVQRAQKRAEKRKG